MYRPYFEALEIIGSNKSRSFNPYISNGASEDVRSRKIGDQSTGEFHKTPTPQKTCLGQNED